MKKNKLFVMLLSGVLTQFSHAATSFDDQKVKLQKILQCDASEFPTTKKQQADLDAFAKTLKKSGVKVKTIGDGGAEDEDNYLLPSAVSVFGQDIKLINNYQAPFVSINFSIPPQELVRLISGSTGMKFVFDKPNGMYALAENAKINVKGKKYPFEHGIFVSKGEKTGSQYVCRYDNTDPNIGG